MKMHHVGFVTAVLSAVLGMSAQAVEKKFVVDPVHSGLNFRIRHLYSMFQGRIDSFSGTITCDTNDLASMKVRASADVTSISTANSDRDKHLRSADFFNVEKYPTATFESTKVVPGAGGDLSIRGNLSMRGVTAEVVFAGKILGQGADPKGVLRVGYHGTATIDRMTFGVAYNAALASGMTMLGNEVELLLDVEAFEAGAPTGTRPPPEAKPADLKPPT